MDKIPLSKQDCDAIMRFRLTLASADDAIGVKWMDWHLKRFIDIQKDDISITAAEELITNLLCYSNELKDASIILGTNFSDAKNLLLAHSSSSQFLAGRIRQQIAMERLDTANK